MKTDPLARAAYLAATDPGLANLEAAVADRSLRLSQAELEALVALQPLLDMSLRQLKAHLLTVADTTWDAPPPVSVDSTISS